MFLPGEDHEHRFEAALHKTCVLTDYVQQYSLLDKRNKFESNLGSKIHTISHTDLKSPARGHRDISRSYDIAYARVYYYGKCVWLCCGCGHHFQ